MSTKKKIRPTRTSRTQRYTTKQSAAPVSEESTEQSWIVLAMGLFVFLGIALISAVVYVLLLG